MLATLRYNLQTNSGASGNIGTSGTGVSPVAIDQATPNSTGIPPMHRSLFSTASIKANPTTYQTWPKRKPSCREEATR